jgi:predicted RNA-binding Zn-ribbon protein involved in translation (DUF1610 family)
MTTPNNVVKFLCPKCGKELNLKKDNSGRWVLTTAGSIIGAIIGGIIGASIGIATGGAGIAATVPLGIAAGGALGTVSYVIGNEIDKRATYKCPKCNEDIKLP